MMILFRLAVTNVHYKCSKMWYTHSDGLALGASLAVILANWWMTSFEKFFQKPNEGRENKNPGIKGMCIDCNQRVIFRGKRVDCKSCENWFQAKFQISQIKRKYRKLYGPVRIVRKKVQQRTHRN